MQYKPHDGCTRLPTLLTTVQGRDEDDLVAVLELILALALELPISIVHEHKDARPPTQSGPSVSQTNNCIWIRERDVGARADSHCPVLDKQLLALLQQIVP